jgi:hypothetical protein
VIGKAAGAGVGARSGGVEDAASAGRAEHDEVAGQDGRAPAGPRAEERARDALPGADEPALEAVAG